MPDKKNPTQRHPRRRLHCHGPGCGIAFPHKSGAGLHCSARCETNDANAMKRHERDLIARGFKKDEKAPNLFVKDGIGITLEMVKHMGIREVVACHKQARRP